jgi:hypothetical protein
MPELRNPRWERFCNAYLDCGNASEAYRKAGYSAKSCDADAARLRVNESVKQRLLELRAKRLYEINLGREQLAGFYGACITTPAGEINEHHPLCQSYEVSEKGKKLKMPDKVAAATALARLSGWDAPSKVEITINPLTEYLRSLRNASMPTDHAHYEPIDHNPLMIKDETSNH